MNAIKIISAVTAALITTSTLAADDQKSKMIGQCLSNFSVQTRIPETVTYTQFDCVRIVLQDECGSRRLRNAAELENPSNRCVVSAIQNYFREKEEAAEAAKLQQQAAQEKARQRQQAAQEKAQQQQERFNAALANRIELDKAAGYKYLKTKDLQLDGRQLAAANTKIAVWGYYAKHGQIEAVFPSEGASFLFNSGHSSEEKARGVVVISEDASRTIRAYLLDCSNALCPVALLGRASMCTRTTLVGTNSVPCLIVDDGWSPIILNID